MNYQKSPLHRRINRTLELNTQLAMSFRSAGEKNTKDAFDSRRFVDKTNVFDVGLNKPRAWTLSSYMEDVGGKPRTKTSPSMDKNNDTDPCSTWSLSDMITKVNNKTDDNPIPRLAQTSTSNLKQYDTIDVSIFEQVLNKRNAKKITKKSKDVIDESIFDIVLKKKPKDNQQTSAFHLKQYDDIENQKVLNKQSSRLTPQESPKSPNLSQSFRFDDDSIDDKDDEPDKVKQNAAYRLENEEEMDTSENLLETCDNLLLQPESQKPPMPVQAFENGEGCDKTVSKSCDLVVHLRTHQDEQRAFVADQTFRQKADFQRQETKHGIGGKSLRVDNADENDEATIGDDAFLQESQSKKPKHSNTAEFKSEKRRKQSKIKKNCSSQQGLNFISQSQQSSSGFSQFSKGRGDKKKQQFVQCKESFRKGIWVQCNSCQKWRYLKDTHDSDQVPAIWHCHLNPDLNFKDCQTPQDPEYDDLQYVPSEFVVGTIKWVKIGSFPSWPAIIDDNPDTKTSIWHSDPDPQSGQMMTKVHVVFFDSLNGTVTRSWVNVNDTQPFIGTETLKKAADVDSIAASDELELFYDNFKSALNSAKKASKLSLQSRRSMYCALYKTKDSYKFR